MYERSAIVLERYYTNVLKLDEKPNLKTNYKNFKDLVEEIQKYQITLEKEETVIYEFDTIANGIRSIQQEQKKIYKLNIRLEEERNQLFENLDENPALLERKLQKVQETIIKNNEKLEELKAQFVKYLSIFNEKQKERNIYSRERRTEEQQYLKLIEEANKTIEEIGIDTLKKLKTFISSENKIEEQEVTEIMINNGIDEKLPFNRKVIEKAVSARNKIAKKEAECYIMVFDKMRKLLIGINDDEIKIEKNKKASRDISVKLAFLKAEKNYIVSFLDNERMTSINGEKVHNQLMEDACQKFDLDIKQFDNLYELILREITNKSTKKAYKELFNKEYLKNIEEKERSFEKEINNIKIQAGTIINSNYWRIDEIKNIYDVFLNEVSEKFEKDLSEYKLETIDETEEFEENDKDILEYEDIDYDKNDVLVNEDLYEEDDDEINSIYEGIKEDEINEIYQDIETEEDKITGMYEDEEEIEEDTKDEKSQEDMEIENEINKLYEDIKFEEDQIEEINEDEDLEENEIQEIVGHEDIETEQEEIFEDEKHEEEQVEEVFEDEKHDEEQVEEVFEEEENDEEQVEEVFEDEKHDEEQVEEVFEEEENDEEQVEEVFEDEENDEKQVEEVFEEDDDEDQIEEVFEKEIEEDKTERFNEEIEDENTKGKKTQREIKIEEEINKLYKDIETEEREETTLKNNQQKESKQRHKENKKKQKENKNNKKSIEQLKNVDNDYLEDTNEKKEENTNKDNKNIEQNKIQNNKQENKRENKIIVANSSSKSNIFNYNYNNKSTKSNQNNNYKEKDYDEIFGYYDFEEENKKRKRNSILEVDEPQEEWLSGNEFIEHDEYEKKYYNKYNNEEDYNDNNYNYAQGNDFNQKYNEYIEDDTYEEKYNHKLKKELDFGKNKKKRKGKSLKNQILEKISNVMQYDEDELEYIEVDDDDNYYNYDDYDENADLTNILKQEIMKNADEDDLTKVLKNEIQKSAEDDNYGNYMYENQEDEFNQKKRKNSIGFLDKFFKDKKW